ncbi:Dimodular nonribosomal peptide synthase [Zhongshania aliphaticivorans]|uniref:Dimodular nonribosomal peptide synthase n=1 Tax=Zhongshania aliphaticivorans TaxID=1470434 RepID=A0A5S9NET7_9GAMM|nr:non-ribosomal peptide synthetase [Zhongshania aliphaticivorans]CAA0088885.1 Dimodular nonribosomal peptide synthase [Zhongshania aliphaticivorans]CAA0095339.1 Dimodular nonribosomal peptide synthase [Zhongshania aliphaticivorans]
MTESIAAKSGLTALAHPADKAAQSVQAFKELKIERSSQRTLVSPETKFLPLAQAQRGLWFGEKIGPKDAVYNIAEYCEILGDIDVGNFIAALKQITQEAETTRVEIHDTEDGPQQIILDKYKGEFPFVDMSAAKDPRADAEAWMMDDLSQPLDLACDPLWFCALFKINENCYFWYQRSHHVVLDGFGAGILSKRCAEIYNALVDNRDAGPNPFLSLNAQHQQEAHYKSSPRYERDRAYWLEQLKSLPDPVSLTRHNAVRAGGLRRSTARLSTAASAELRILSKDVGASVPQVLISLFAAYIYRMTGADDLVFGMPVTARANRDMRSTPSMMANAVSIRLAMTDQLNLAGLATQVSKTVRQSLRHQQFRYEDIRRELGLLGQGQQISWVGVNIEPFDYDLRFGGHQCLAHNISNGTVEDLTVFIYDRGEHDGLRVDFDANPALYTQPDLDTHRDRFVRLINAVVADPVTPISQINLLSDLEKQQLLVDWNNTAVPLPNTSLPLLFTEQAARTPDAIAVTSGDKAISYQALQYQVDQITQLLIDRNIGTGDIVAVALPRDESMPAALLAIMKSGAAYLPLDPCAPAERLAMIIEEGKPTLTLSTSSISNTQFSDSNHVINLDTITFPEVKDTLPVSNCVTGDSSAYVIYTSGSTGRPKGVEISHSGLLNFLLAMQAELQISTDDTLLALTTVAFDIAVLELYLPLILGARVVIADRVVAKDPAALVKLIQDQNVSVMQATPSHWQALLADEDEALRNVRPLVGGEALPAQLARKMRKLGHPIVNLYGPTETTIWSTIMRLEGDDLDSPPIGRPIQNTTVYVLDKAMQPVPLSAIGELYIGGEGVAKGYLHRPELTAERFVANPFGKGRLYKTGDLARWRNDGVLEYLGRNDFQIKIRGFRVEAEEVEANIQRCDGVRQAVVTLQAAPCGNNKLVAYVLPLALENGELQAIDTALLKKHLEQTLPDYMIPSMFIYVSEFPTNVNGKLDRKALPEPIWQNAHAYVAPRTPLETQLAALWCEVFEVEQVGINDSFFDLGGDSLTAARMVAKLRELLKRDIPLAAVFEASTIAELSEQIEKQEAVDPLGMILPLKSTGTSAPLFCIHPVIGLSWAYSGLARHLSSDQNLYGIQARGLATEFLETSATVLPQSIGEMAKEYIDHIRRVQPAGPYHLLGWSMGGLLAHEITRRLEADGETINYLAILDAYPYVQKDQNCDEESHLVKSALLFMGLPSDALPVGSETMKDLTELLCREYDIYNLPFVKEMQESNSNIIEGVRQIIENNLAISRSFTPGKVNADMLFIGASQTAETELGDLLHNNAKVWQNHVGELTVHQVSCHHQQMFDAEPLELIGPLIAESLKG